MDEDEPEVKEAEVNNEEVKNKKKKRIWKGSV